MSHLLAQCNIERDTGLPRDRVVNTFHFQGFGDFAEPGIADTIVTRLRAFYAGMGFGSIVATTGHRIRVYDQGQAIPRIPIVDADLPITTAASSLPAEVALCVSFRGQLINGAEPKRRRGRVYIGPIPDTQDTLDAADSRPLASFVTAWRDKAAALMNANTNPNVAGGLAWVVAGMSGLVDVRLVWVDDAWDTQRRRGAAPTTRQQTAGGLGPPS